MENFEYFNTTILSQHLILRNEETKFGEKIKYPANETISLADFINETKASFIIFGIKEFAGIKANHGRVGATHSWDIFLASFLNIQNNKYLKGSKVAVIGCLNYDAYNTEIANLDTNKPVDLERLYEIVAEIDKDVTYLNTLIHRAGKKAIVIGGGHNNAYGNIKGLALATGSSINVVNFDAHTDFRLLEGRHSGNGFSYAFNEGFLDTYCVFGAHENYLNKHMIHQFKNNTDKLHLFTFEDIKVRFEKDFFTSINNINKLIKNKPYGIEIDVDAVENISSSAMSSSGFTVTETRQFVNLTANNAHASYLHLCEGSASLGTSPANMLGKLLTYLVTDFVKAQLPYVKS